MKERNRMENHQRDVSISGRRMTRSSATGRQTQSKNEGGQQIQNIYRHILLNPPIVLLKPLKRLHKLNFDHNNHFEKSKNPRVQKNLANFETKNSTQNSVTVIDEQKNDCFGVEIELENGEFEFTANDSKEADKMVHTSIPGDDPISDYKDCYFWGCKICGMSFPLNLDHLYRRHMLITHGMQLTNREILNSKIHIWAWTQCPTCFRLVDKSTFAGHNRQCPLATLSVGNLLVRPKKPVIRTGPKLACGICPATHFDSRLYLRSHLMSEHSEVSSRIILEPFLRCGICLSSFEKEGSGSSQLILHVKNCQGRSAANAIKTLVELKDKNLWCQICRKKHANIRHTMSCYQKKSMMRCVLCFQVHLTRGAFVSHLKLHHGHLQGSGGRGLCCPFCEDGEVRNVKEAFGHFIDEHLNRF